jgi:hypothetical protein
MQHSLRRASRPTTGKITHGTPVEVAKPLALRNVLATSLGLSLLRSRRLAAKDILLDLASGCFRQLGLSATLNR